MRYDVFISKRLNISRNQALELINSKRVLLNSQHLKASFNVQNLFTDKMSDEELIASKELDVKVQDKIYVSRAALKLKAFLAELNLKLKDKLCLDIGASKGGFVEVLLENEVRKIYALDVGFMQLDDSLRANERVVCVENTDLRAFKSAFKFDFISCDVSFISLLKLLPYINSLALDDIILLFKPQFELGLDVKKSKKGLILDDKALAKARLGFEKECSAYAWELILSSASALKGKNGNLEYFYYYKKR